MDYGHIIEYIVIGLDNKTLNKLISYKKINIGSNNIRDVNEKTRHIIIRQLLSKNNLFIIYRLIADNKITIPEELIQIISKYPGEIESEIWIQSMENGQIPKLLGTSYFLIYLIQTQELSKAIDIFEDHKNILDELRDIKLNNKNLTENSLEEDYKNLLLKYNSLNNKFDKQEKKRLRDIKQFENKEKRLNTEIDRKNEEISKQKILRKEIEKKYQDLLSEISNTKQQDDIHNKNIESLTLQVDHLKKEVSLKSEEVKVLKADQLKKYNMIEEFQNSEHQYIIRIKKLEREIENIIDESCIADDIVITDTSDTKVSNFNDIEIKQEDSGIKVSKELNYDRDFENKILIFGDISKYSFAKNNIKSIFDIYNRDNILENIESIDETDYIEIWLLSHQITKKSLKNTILKKFKNVIIINNITELERMYDNAK